MSNLGRTAVRHLPHGFLGSLDAFFRSTNIAVEFGHLIFGGALCQYVDDQVQQMIVVQAFFVDFGHGSCQVRLALFDCLQYKSARSGIPELRTIR